MSFIMFPHTYLPESVLRTMILFFGNITICLPWYTDDGPINNQDNIKFVKPPESMKPSKKIGSIAVEFENWMANHEDRSYREIVKSGLAVELRDENTWEIREMMRNMVGESSTAAEDDIALKWHLMLFLARKAEEQRFEADITLKRIKQKKAIFEGSVEKVDEKISLLGDLPRFDQDSMDDSNLSRVLEAWLGLFGSSLSERDILITMDYRILGFLAELWDSNEIGSSWPEMKFLLSSEYLACLENNTGKKPDFSNNQQSKELRDLILRLREDRQSALEGLNEHAKKYSPDTEPGSSNGYVNIKIKHLSPPADIEPYKEDILVSGLADKTVIYMESM